MTIKQFITIFGTIALTIGFWMAFPSSGAMILTGMLVLLVALFL